VSVMSSVSVSFCAM